MRIEPGASLGRYRLLEPVGSGGMGVVWKALDTRLRREVAVKLLPGEPAADPKALAAFEHEARAVAALNHPNIVTIHSVEEAEGVHFFTMELLAGHTLRELIPAGGMVVERALEIALAVIGALEAAHARGIVHRDLKPANVAVTLEGQVKLLDFGLALVRRGEPVGEGTAAATAVGALADGVVGTLHYMAPEQVRGWDVDARADIFAFGVILHEMLTGRRPFEGQTIQTLTAAILMDALVPPSRLRPELSRRLDEVVVRCTEKDRELRLQTAADVRDLLTGARHDVQASAGEPMPSIAVLPFADMSQERDQDYFCEGVAEEIITALAQLRTLQVASRISSFQFKGAPLDSREIGRRLGVRHLLEGSVRKAAGRLRISIELTDVEAGFCLWSGRYDREMKDIFAVQEEIAKNVVQAFQLTPSSSRRAGLARPSTGDVEAYEFYLKGRMYFYQYNRRGIEFARQMFARAIELDPDYALAHAGLADCCTFLFMHVLGREEMRAAALEAARRAVELGPELAPTHVALGQALSLTQDHAAAEREFEKALALDPRLFEAHYFYARTSFMQGDVDKAIRLYEEASALRPEDYQAPLLLGQLYEDLKHGEKAESSRRRGLKAAEVRLALHPDDVRALYMGANALVALGERERGLEWAQRAFVLDPDDAMLLYNLACIYAIATRTEEALDFLERSVRAGMNRPAWVRHDSNLESIRSHPRYEAVLRTLEGQAPAD